MTDGFTASSVWKNSKTEIVVILERERAACVDGADHSAGIEDPSPAVAAGSSAQFGPT